MYENYVCGIVEKEDFDMMKERYIQNLQELRDELQAAKQKQRMLEKKADRYMDMVNNLEHICMNEVSMKSWCRNL